MLFRSVAGAFRIVTISNGLQHERREVFFDAEGIPERVGRLAETGVDVLICGAISWPLEMAVSAAGIEVIPQVCGDVEQVLTAWTDGRFRQEAFLMPGCCGRRRQRRAGRRRGGCW